MPRLVSKERARGAFNDKSCAMEALRADGKEPFDGMNRMQTCIEGLAAQ